MMWSKSSTRWFDFSLKWGKYDLERSQLDTVRYENKKNEPELRQIDISIPGATYMVSSTSIPETMPVPAAMPAGRLRMPIPTMPGHHESEQRAFMENLMKTPCTSIPSGVVRNIVQIFSFSETIFEVGDRQCLMKIVD